MDDSPARSRCRVLKAALEKISAESGLRSRARGGATTWQIVNRIAIEELEAWYFGEWTAVRLAYPKVPETIPQQAPYRQPDAIDGGTWEAFERVMRRHGYFATGLRKVEAARAIGLHVDAGRSRREPQARALAGPTAPS